MPITKAIAQVLKCTFDSGWYHWHYTAIALEVAWFFRLAHYLVAGAVNFIRFFIWLVDIEKSIVVAYLFLLWLGFFQLLFLWLFLLPLLLLWLLTSWNRAGLRFTGRRVRGQSTGVLFVVTVLLSSFPGLSKIITMCSKRYICTGGCQKNSPLWSPLLHIYIHMQSCPYTSQHSSEGNHNHLPLRVVSWLDRKLCEEPWNKHHNHQNQASLASSNLQFLQGFVPSPYSNWDLLREWECELDSFACEVVFWFQILEQAWVDTKSSVLTLLFKL